MAVYTELSDAEISAFLSQFDQGEFVAARGISEGVENSNYLLETDQKCLILTIYEQRVASEDLPFFLKVMHRLSEAGIPCPLPIEDRRGQDLHTLKGKSAALFSFLQGASPRGIQPDHCASVGDIAARMHLAMTGFALSRKNALNYSGWCDLFAAMESRLKEQEPATYTLVKETLTALKSVWPKNLPSGVIHADLFPDNVLFDGAKLTGLLDFYFACNDFYAYDLAICINAWCFESGFEFNITKARRMCHAYQQVRPLSDAEIDALPILAQGAALRFLLTRQYDTLFPKGGLSKPKNPKEYLEKLKFHQQVKSASEYGL